MADGNIPALAGDPPGISEAALKKAEEFIEADEGVQNRLSGTAGNVATIVAVRDVGVPSLRRHRGTGRSAGRRSSRRNRCATRMSLSHSC